MLSPQNAPGVALLSVVDVINPPLSVIFGISGYELTQGEKDFFSKTNPLGFILFARNIRDPQQLKDLTQSLKDCLGREAPILIDQEGGRVARMRPPHWPAHPTPRLAAAAAAQDLAQAVQNVGAVNQAIAQSLRDVGINVNCTPVVDVYFDNLTHAAIGERAFSNDPAVVGVLGAEVCRAHLAEGVIPVVKHMPGQGRADLDSHTHLPVVSASLKELESADFVPYRHILSQKFAQAVWGMVSHIIYSAIDSTNPATCSPAVMGLIRHDLGFNGFLLSDDIVMQALSCVGDMGQRAERAVAAGCDAVLHCNGVMAEMEIVAKAAPKLSAASVQRFNASLGYVVS